MTLICQSQIYFEFTLNFRNFFPLLFQTICLCWKVWKMISIHNHLDTRFIHEMKFRIKLLNKSLSTNQQPKKKNIIQHPNCPFCGNEETIDHLWECQTHITNTTKSLLYKEFTDNLQNRYKAPNPNAIDLTQDPNLVKFLNILQLEQIDLDLSNQIPHTNGIITNKLISQTQRFQKQKTTHNQTISKTQLMIMILDCWYNSLYKNIWIPRNKKAYETINNTQTSRNSNQPNQRHHNTEAIRRNHLLNEQRMRRQQRQHNPTTNNQQNPRKRPPTSQLPNPPKRIIISFRHNTIKPIPTLPKIIITRTQDGTHSIRTIYRNEPTPEISIDIHDAMDTT